MSGMSIAYLCADRGIPIGGTKGASVHVRGVAEALHRIGNRVRVVAARVEAEVEEFGSDVFAIGFDRTQKLVRDAIASSGGDAAMAREVYGLMLNQGAERALESLHADEPVQALYERYSLWSWTGLRFSRANRIPWILEVNAPLVSEQKTYRGIRLEPAAAGIQDLLLREADAIVVPSQELKDFVRERTGGRSGVVVLPNGVDIDLVDSAAPLPHEICEPLQSRFVVAFSGSLKPWHGIERLLKAFERLNHAVSDAHLLMIGDGPLGSEVERFCKRLGTDVVTWTGAVPHKEVFSWLRYADVGVAPYPALDDFYFSPMKIVEYLACGLPVVASDIGQIRELIQHGETGFLVPPGDSHALADTLQMLAGNRQLRQRMGRRADRRARRVHDWKQVAEQIVELFERRLGRRDAFR